MPAAWTDGRKNGTSSAGPVQDPSPPWRSPAIWWSRICVTARHRRARAGETRVAFPVPVRTHILADDRSLWPGPSPLPQHHADPCPAGGHSPRPVPAPPPAGALHPPGRALATVLPGPAGLQGTSVRGQGKRGSRFPIPPGRTFSRMPGHSGKGHRLCHSAPSPLVQPGAIAPRPAPAPPSAGASRPPGRALTSVLPGPAGLQGSVPRGRGKRGSRFLIPPGPKPPASARPAPGGRFAPAGPGAGLCFSRTCRSAGDLSARAGETRCVSGCRQ